MSDLQRYIDKRSALDPEFAKEFEEGDQYLNFLVQKSRYFSFRASARIYGFWKNQQKSGKLKPYS